MTKSVFGLLNLILSVIFLVSGCVHDKDENYKKAVFKIEYDVGNKPYATQKNAASGFVCKLDDSIPELFLTAHHVVQTSNFFSWNQIKDSIRHPKIRSLSNPQEITELGENIPIEDAKPTALDIAAFLIVETDRKTPFLKFARTSASFGDTIFLLTRLTTSPKNNPPSLYKGVVVHKTDSTLAWLYIDKHLRFEALFNTSGSPVLNKDFEIVANAFGGFYNSPDLPKEIRDGINNIWPGLSLSIKPNTLYGGGVPALRIKKALLKGWSTRHRLSKLQP